MSFLRPAAEAALRRWGEALAGLGVAALGLWAALASWGLLAWMGWALAAAGAALAVAGWQRGRFARGGGGPGVVTLTEGRIAYFGPLSGGVVDLDTLEALGLDPTGRPLHWVLTPRDGPALHVPVNAEGADALFDAFAALPGLGTERVLRALDRPGRAPLTLWRRSAVHTSLRLH
ncbi:hypothetical protein [Roseivivax sp. CAU 1761]